MSELALPGLWLPPKPRIVKPQLIRPRWRWRARPWEDAIAEAVALDVVGNTGVNASASTSVTMNASNTIAVGSLVVVGMGRFHTTGTVTMAMSGGLGGWTSTPSTGVTNGSYRVYLAWTFATSGLSSGSLIGNVTASSASDITAVCIAYSGVDTSGTAVASSTGTGAATAWNTGSFAGGAGNAYVAVSAGDAGASRTSLATSPAQERIDFFGSTSGGSITMADKLSGSASDSVAGAWSANITHGTVGVAFKALAGGGGGTTIPRRALMGVGF